MKNNPRQQEGFLCKGRIVYSVLYSLESESPRIMQLVVVLDREGNSLNGRARPTDPRKRIVHVKPGETIRFRGETFTVIAVEAYRWTMLNRDVA